MFTYVRQCINAAALSYDSTSERPKSAMPWLNLQMYCTSNRYVYTRSITISEQHLKHRPRTTSTYVRYTHLRSYVGSTNICWYWSASSVDCCTAVSITNMDTPYMYSGRSYGTSTKLEKSHLDWNRSGVCTWIQRPNDPYTSTQSGILVPVLLCSACSAHTYAHRCVMVILCTRSSHVRTDRVEWLQHEMCMICR